MLREHMHTESRAADMIIWTRRAEKDAIESPSHCGSECSLSAAWKSVTMNFVWLWGRVSAESRANLTRAIISSDYMEKVLVFSLLRPKIGHKSQKKSTANLQRACFVCAFRCRFAMLISASDFSFTAFCRSKFCYFFSSPLRGYLSPQQTATKQNAIIFNITIFIIISENDFFLSCGAGAGLGSMSTERERVSERQCDHHKNVNYFWLFTRRCRTFLPGHLWDNAV